MLANDTSGGVTLTGLNLDIESPNRNGTKAHYHFSASVASTETPRAMSVDPEAGAAGSLCAALVVIN